MFSQLFIFNMYTEILITFGVFLLILIVGKVVRNVNEIKGVEDRILNSALRIEPANEIVLES